MNALLAARITQSLEALLSISDNKVSREHLAKQQGNDAFAVAKDIYEFVVSYPVNWNTDVLTDELIEAVRMAAKSRYPFLPDESIKRLGYHFAYLHK